MWDERMSPLADFLVIPLRCRLGWHHWVRFSRVNDICIWRCRRCHKTVEVHDPVYRKFRR
jgi:hypothetical protein